MKYEHSFQVRAPLEAVAAFHARSASLAAMTPPPLSVQLGKTPERLAEGDVMSFRLRFGPASLGWVARIEEVGPTGFTDRQIHGPFHLWVHSHGFYRINGTTTEVRDSIEASIRLHPVYAPLGLAMWISLPLLFVYRTWRTRKELEARPVSRQDAA